MEDATPPARKRYHDLDALRATAMLLGIALHGILSFAPSPWFVADSRQSPVYQFIFEAIHGFRMPIFFLVSGFFTAMLWRNRGPLELIKHRLKRILLPLVIALPCVGFALTYGIGLAWELKLGGIVGRPASDTPEVVEDSIWNAAKQGDTESILRHLEAGASVGGKDAIQATAIHYAAGCGQNDAVALLLENGAKLSFLDGNRSTPLHWAAFFGQLETVQFLIAEGADPNARNNNGEVPHDSVAAPWSDEVRDITFFIAALVGVEIDIARIKVARPKIHAYLKEKADVRDREKNGPEEGAIGRLLEWIIVGSTTPFFHHLWFLYYLLWLVAGFVAVASLGRKLGWKKGSAALIASPWRLLWLLPLTLVPQLMMGLLGMFFGIPGFGPDTAIGLVPWPPVLLYYGIFFAVGALSYGHREFDEKVGARWGICLLLAIPALLLGLHWYEMRNEAFQLGFDDHRSEVIGSHFLTSLCQVIYTWLMVFFFIGFFRRFFSSENKRVRYVSDASYWLYIAHLPLIIMAQILVMDSPYPSFMKFLFICTVTTGFLLVVYEYGIRYTPIGTLLNGKRTRDSSPG
ncbi:MAG TPA: hypothetical protein EYN40_01855 [Planctomycetes bacterium]|nr:hypothetical protein [Planctomycetota bacterium]